MFLDDFRKCLAILVEKYLFTLVQKIVGKKTPIFVDFSKIHFLAKSLTIFIDSLWNFLSKKVYFYKLYFISFQATTKTIFTKRYKFARVVPFWKDMFIKCSNINCYC